jgi:hypothetical protein
LATQEQHSELNDGKRKQDRQQIKVTCAISQASPHIAGSHSKQRRTKHQGDWSVLARRNKRQISR